MNNVNYLVGSEHINHSPLSIFNEDVCAFLKDLSATLLKSPLIRVHKDLSALAFWARPANIQNLKKRYSEQEYRIGRGLCFHIAPSNIPVNFAFSYVFSLLAGNANIVRLPSKDFPQIDALLSILRATLKNYPEIESRTAFVRYPVSNEITADFSLQADTRMIWGGDRTIASIKTLPTKPRCVDITFADRYSLSIIDGQKICDADEKTLKRIAEGFYNDTYLMDQNACSSPQLILWQNDSKKARDIFWKSVFTIAQNQYTLQDAICVSKYTQLCEDSVNIDYIARTERVENLLYRIELDRLDSSIIHNRGKSGYFYEYAITNMAELFSIITEKYQTITYFGIDTQNLTQQLLLHNVKGIDRIVPIGKAMDIGAVWDGHDIVRELSRVINLY